MALGEVPRPGALARACARVAGVPGRGARALPTGEPRVGRPPLQRVAWGATKARRGCRCCRGSVDHLLLVRGRSAAGASDPRGPAGPTDLAPRRARPTNAILALSLAAGTPTQGLFTH